MVRRVLRGVRWGVLAAVVSASCGCAGAPTIVDGGIYGGGWIVMEWRGLLVELRAEAGCESKGECGLTACVTVAGGEPVCREVE